MLGTHQTNVLLLGEITPEAASLYAYITNFSNLSPARVAVDSDNYYSPVMPIRNHQ